MRIKSMNILIVDDNPLILDSFSDHLVGLGANVTTTSSGEKAIKLIEGGRSFDLIITDILMAEGDGIEVIRAARRSHLETKIIAMSGGGQIDADDYLMSAQLLGATSVLRKPIHMRELDSTIATL